MFERIFGISEQADAILTHLDEMDLYAAQSHPVQLKNMRNNRNIAVEQPLVAELRFTNKKLQSKVTSSKINKLVHQ